MALTWFNWIFLGLTGFYPVLNRFNFFFGFNCFFLPDFIGSPKRLIESSDTLREESAGRKDFQQEEQQTGKPQKDGWFTGSPQDGTRFLRVPLTNILQPVLAISFFRSDFENMKW